MKIYRLLVVLLALICGLPVFAQDSNEFTSLRAKAIKGNGIAQYNLGLAYVQGKGTAADPIEGYVWLALARENGARGRALDNLVASFDRATYEAAQKRLADRKVELGLKPAATASTPAPTENPVAPDNRPAPAATEDAALAQLRAERDGLAVRINNLAGDIANLRTERERLIKLSGDHEKAARDATEAGRAAEARAGELAKAAEAAKAESDRAKQALAALQSAPKPAADTPALDRKTRELQAALAELETSRNFGTQVESTLNKVTDQKTALEQQLATATNESNRLRSEAAALAQTRDEARQQLNAVAAEHTALQSEVAQLRARPAAPAYPDLSARVRELETALAAAKSAVPNYPDLSGRVRELEAQVSSDLSAVASAKEEATRAKQEIAALTKAKEDTQRQLAAKPAAPAYPDLRSNVAALETALAAAKSAAPRYPDLSGRVRELETSLADLSSEATRAKQEIAALTKAKEDTQRQLAAKPAAPAWPDLRANVTALEGQLASAQQALAARSKPVVDTAALDQKNRELSAALAELEASRTFGRQVEDALNKVNDEKARVAAAAAAELEAARKFGTQVESTLNRVTDQKSALEQQLATAANEANRVRSEAAALAKARDEAQQHFNAVAAEHAALQSEVAQLRARPAAPAYPDLSGRVAELEAALAALSSEAGRAKQEIVALTKAKEEARQPAAPASPDLSGRVRELEQVLADTNRLLVAAQNARPAAPGYPDLSGRVAELETALATSIQKFGTAEQARAELSKQFDDYKSATITAQRERTTMLAQVKMLESDKTALRRQAEAATAETGQLRTQLAAAKMQQAAIKPAAPAYPDLSGKVGELEAQVSQLQAVVAAKPAAPGYPDLSGRVRELETALAAKPAAPAYPDLSGRVSELEGQLARARQPAAPRYPDLSGRVRELEAQLAAKPAAPAYPDLTGRVNELETALAAARNAAPAYPDLSARVRELETQVAGGSSALAAARQEAAALAQAKTDSQARIASLTAERDNARNAQAEMRDTIARLAQEKTALAASKATPAYPDLRDRVTGLESDLAASQKALAAKPAAPAYPDLSGKVGELEAQVGRLQAAVAAKPAAPAYPDLSGRVAELEGQVATAGASGRQSATALSLANDQIAQLKSALAAKPAAPGYPDLSGRVTELESALAAARNAAPAYPDLSARVGELETKLATAEKAAAEKPAAPAYPDLSGRVTELSGEIAQLRTDRERMQKMLADAGRQLRDNTADAARIKDLETQLAATRSRPIAPPGYIDRMRELEAALAEAKAAAQPAAPAYPDFSGRVRELETAAADSARQLIAAEAAQTGLKQQLAEATGALQNAARSGDDSAKLRRERDELSGRVTELAGELAQLRTDRERMQKMLGDAGRQLRDNTADTARIKDLETLLAASQASATGITAERDTARGVQNELRETIARLEQEKSQLASARPEAPAYPDLSGRVRELEAQVAALANAPRGRAPAYPDLSGRVTELEAALAEARQRPATVAAPAATGATSEHAQKHAATADPVATSLRGYALLEKDRDELAARTSRAADAVTAEKNALATQVAALAGEVAQLRASAQNNAGSTQAEIARLQESFTALQRSTAQNASDLAASRALAQQLQGANAVLAGENYQLKTMLSRTAGAVAAAPAAVPAPRVHVVAGGDSLSRISQRYYGTANRWQEIFNANTDRIAANGLLRIGTELRIP